MIDALVATLLDEREAQRHRVVDILSKWGSAAATKAARFLQQHPHLIVSPAPASHHPMLVRLGPALAPDVLAAVVWQALQAGLRPKWIDPVGGDEEVLQSIVHSLAPLLSQSDRSARRYAASHLARMRRLPAECLEPLIEFVHGEVEDGDRETCKSGWLLIAGGAAVFPTIRSWLADGDPHLLLAAAEAAGALGPDGGPLVPALVEILSEELDPVCTEAVLEALYEIGAAAASAAPAMVKFAFDGSDQERFAAFRYIGQLDAADMRLVRDHSGEWRARPISELARGSA